MTTLIICWYSIVGIIQRSQVWIQPWSVIFLSSLPSSRLRRLQLLLIQHTLYFTWHHCPLGPIIVVTLDALFILKYRACKRKHKTPQTLPDFVLASV